MSGGATYASPNWVQQVTRTSPTGVTFGAAAYDPVHDQVVEFGGQTTLTSPPSYINETWVWAAKTQTWVQLSPTTSPSARAGSSMAWDPAISKIVLFGGKDSTGARNDLWAWDGSNWSTITATGTAPAARYGAAMAWDPSRTGLVVFAGNSGSALFNDTFRFSSGAWSTIQVDGATGAPARRQFPSMAYSTSTSQMLLFGGVTATSTTLQDTWVLGGSSWAAQSPADSPDPRYAAGAVYDPGLAAVVIFGGFYQEGFLIRSDTWAWNGSDWLQAASIATPGARYGFSMAATDSGQVVMFGGSTATGMTAQTWLYDTNVPVLSVSFTDANGNPASAFETGDSLTVNVSAQDVGVNSISATSITSTLSNNFLALGSLIHWAGALLGPCDSSPTVCGAILGLSFTVGKLTLSPGPPVWGSYEGTLVGSLIGCTILTIPATAANAFGSSAVASAPLTACGGGLGHEDWWSYYSVDLGGGATAQVNVANGNLLVKQTDSTPIISHGDLGFELGRAYNSQNDMVTPSALGAGWQFDVGRTGPSGIGGFQLATLLVPTLQSAAQPLSVTYIDGDGTRHVFSLHGVAASLGGVVLPVNLRDLLTNTLHQLLDPNTLPFTLSGTVSGVQYNTVCLDATYTGPPGLDEYLFRYVGVFDSNQDCSGGVTSQPGAITLGWSIVRPDRVRYDFDYRGQLLDILDGAGNKLIYKFDNVDRLVDVHSSACTPDTNVGTNPVTGPACPGYTLSYNDFVRDGTNLSRVDVTDPAGRITTYISTRGFEPQLIEVWNPGNPFTTIGPATPSLSYTYSTATTPCPGSAPGTVTVGQMCSATDSDGSTTTFAYTPSPVGPDRVLSITDRRGNAAGGSTTGAETRFTYYLDSASKYVTADTAAPATFGSGSGCVNNSACERIRYNSIDPSGRVGEIDQGNATDAYLRQTAYFWDGDVIPSCNQPSAVVDNNLCETIARAVPSTTAFTPDAVGTATIDGVTVNDQAVKYLYGDMGQLLRKTVLVDPSAGWTDANSDIATYGSHAQYFQIGNTVSAYDDYPTGSGNLAYTLPPSGNDYPTAINADSPTAYYRFNETSGTTLHDRSTGGTHNGSYGPNPVLAQPGRVDNAVQEMGGSFTASVPNGSLASGTGASSYFSVETWIKTTETSVDYELISGSSSSAYAAVGTYTGGLPAIYLASDTTTHQVLSVVGNQSIADGQWHQLDFVYGDPASPSGVSLYVDGRSIGQSVYSSSLSGAFTTSAATVFIGDNTAVSGPDSNSLIDELAYFPAALTSTQVTNHYNAATGNIRLSPLTLYAIADRTETLPPRGNISAASSHWGDYLTTYRRDVPAGTTAPSSYPRPDQTAATSVCGGAAVGNTGLLCETDVPSSANVAAPPSTICKSPIASLPNSPPPPTSAGYTYACATSTYNNFGEKKTTTSPNLNAGAAGGQTQTQYIYYGDTGSCANDRNKCDLSGNVSLGKMLKAVIDPTGHEIVFAYDRAGNIARTWSRNAVAKVSGDPLTLNWTTAASPPSTEYSEIDHANPVTSALLSLSGSDAELVAPDGTVHGSGTNGSGQLGTGNTTNSLVPVSVPGLSDAVAIAQTSSSACPRTIARTGSGAVYQWGNGTNIATRVANLPPVIAIAAGGCHLLALDANGNLWAWGSNSAGQLGDGTTTDRTTPVQVLSGVAAIAAGGQHSLAVMTDGTVRAWGSNATGQLGDGTTSNHSSPTPVSNLSRVLAVAAGSDTSYAIRSDGTAWAWGDNSRGELGTGSAAGQATTPQSINSFGPAAPQTTVRQIVGSDHGAAALMANGDVQVWGDNTHGQLAGAPGTSSNTPLVVTGLTNQVALAGNSSAYLSANAAGTVKVWGLVSQGQIGDGTTPATAVLPETAAYSVSPFSAPWRFTEATRDAVGNLSLSTTDLEGRELVSRPARGTAVVTPAYDAVMTYDADGNLVSNLSPLERNGDHATTTAYDPFGNPTVITAPNGNVVKVMKYDAANRVVEIDTPRSAAANSTNSGCTQTAGSGSYWPAPQVGHVVCVQTLGYDGNDLTITSTDALGQTTLTGYDGAGQKISQGVPRMDSTYTILTTRWNYDANGNVTDICPPRQFDTNNEQDTTTGCTSTGAYSTHYAYDNADQATVATVYRVTGPSSATAETTQYTYDADGNPINVTDARGHTTTNAYDVLDRRTSQAVPRKAGVVETTSWQYDPSGNITAILAPGSRFAGSGSDGALVVDGTTANNSTDHVAHGSANPFQIPDGAQYTNVTLQNGAYATGANAHGLFFYATGTITIDNTSVITETGKGYAGGIGASSGNHAGTNAANPFNGTTGNGGLGGGGSALNSGAGGGGGGHKTAGSVGAKGNGSGTPGTAGAASGTSDFSDVGTNYLLGSGGGGGGGGDGFTTAHAGNGGNGGGFIHIIATNIVINGNGSIEANGTAGANATTNAAGGGGGAGGGIWLDVNSVTPNNPASNLHVAGGTGGTGAGGSNGGNGAAGYTLTQSAGLPTLNYANNITAYSYDADNRVVDTVRGAQTLTADPAQDPGATPDDAGLINQRTRTVYDPDGNIVLTVPPQGFTHTGSLASPSLNTLLRTDYDLDGQVIATYEPRYDSSVPDVASGGDGGISPAVDQQTSQCPTSAQPNAVVGYGAYPTGVGVCITRTTYDSNGNVARQYLPTSNGSDNRYVEYSYTDDNLTLTVTGPNLSGSGRNTQPDHTYLYDGDDRLISDKDANGNTTVTGYTADGLTREIDGQSYTLGGTTITHQTLYTYDADGNQRTVQEPNAQNPTMDDPSVAENNRIAADYTTTMTWTSDGYKSSITAPGLHHGDFDKTTYEYDPLGNPTKVWSPSANAGDLNNPIIVGTGLGLPTVNTFTYDNLIASSSVPTTSSPAKYRSTIYDYTPAGQKLSTALGTCTVTDPTTCTPDNGSWNAGGVLRYTYAPDGLNIDQIGRDLSNGGAGSRTITTHYDQAGRPKSISDTGSSGSSISITASYYLDGLLRTASDGTNSNTYAYDASGDVTVRTDQTGASGITAGATTMTSYAYSDAGLPAQMTSDVTGDTTSWTYDAGGRPTQRVDKSGGSTLRTVTAAYNPDDTISTFSTNASDGTLTERHTYTYDDNGNILTDAASGSAQSAFTDTYHYNPAGNISFFDHGGATTTYTWDHDSNRLTSAGSSTTTWAYNADDSIKTSQITGQSALTFAYGNSGEVTNDGCFHYGYDEFLRTQSVQLTGASSCGASGTTQYTYDGLDRQQTAALGSRTTYTSYDGLTSTVVGQKGAATGGTGTPTVLYQLDPNGDRTAYKQTGSNPTTTFINTDGHGNVTSLLDSGTSTASCAANYDPFGEPLSWKTGTGNRVCSSGPASTTSGNAMWYRSQSRDQSNDEYQLGTRTYNPSNADFTTPDSYRVDSPSQDLSVGTDPLTANTYSYVNGNPVNFFDPDGHCAKLESPSAPCLTATKSAFPTYKDGNIVGFHDMNGKPVGGRGGSGGSGLAVVSPEIGSLPADDNIPQYSVPDCSGPDTQSERCFGLGPSYRSLGPPTAHDYDTKKLLEDIAIIANELGYQYAAKLLHYFLSGKGGSVELSQGAADSLYSVPSVQRVVNAAAQLQLSAGGNRLGRWWTATATGEQTKLDSVGGVDTRPAGSKNAQDWHLAVNSVDVRVYLTEVTPSNISFRLQFVKYYNFSGQSPFKVAGVTISGVDLGRMNGTGLAQNFNVFGTSDVITIPR